MKTPKNANTAPKFPINKGAGHGMPDKGGQGAMPGHKTGAGTVKANDHQMKKGIGKKPAC